MRISDWSSDVCSSYLLKPSPSRGGFGWGWVSPTPPQIKSRRGRSPDLRQGFDGFAITQRDGVAVAVVAVDDHAVAADHHFAHQVAVAAEEIGRAHVCTPVNNAHLVCRLLLENKQKSTIAARRAY